MLDYVKPIQRDLDPNNLTAYKTPDEISEILRLIKELKTDMNKIVISTIGKAFTEGQRL